MENNKNYIAWIPVIELAVLAFTTLGTTITLFLHSDSKINEFRKESLAEMKDFHSKMERQDSEFKEYLMSFNGRLERQDAELKAFLMNQYSKNRGEK